MIKERDFQYKGQTLELKDVFARRGKNITSSQIKCKTLSPFLIRVHNRQMNKDEYKLLSEDNLQECNRHLNIIMGKIFRDVLGREYEIKVVPEKIKKLPVKVQEGENIGVIVSNQGTFYLEGEEKVLQMLYQTGIGSRRSYGFGLFEVIK